MFFRTYIVVNSTETFLKFKYVSFQQKCYQGITTALNAAAVDDSVSIVALTGAGEVVYIQPGKLIQSLNGEP